MLTLDILDKKKHRKCVLSLVMVATAGENKFTMCFIGFHEQGKVSDYDLG